MSEKITNLVNFNMEMIANIGKIIKKRRPPILFKIVHNLTRSSIEEALSILFVDHF